ncbi:MAG: ABC transporter ATP-binding protein [Alphaproteobacteria bacterium]|nr:ABC transporter ATP-binding protein [Alphaproteobacteria bacterium]
MNKQAPVLDLRNITKSYPQGHETLTILKKCSFKIYPGEIVGLLGVSGSGKSSLLHIAGLLDAPTEGTVLIKGIQIENQKDALQTKWRNESIGFVYQFHHLLPEFTALENVMLPQLMKGIAFKQAEKKAQHALETLGLRDRLLHFPSELSGGEQQRVAIARAFINDPALILADEPTGNLDLATAHKVFDLFLTFAKENGVACLIATHDQALAKKMDRMVELQDGSLVERHR